LAAYDDPGPAANKAVALTNFGGGEFPLELITLPPLISINMGAAALNSRDPILLS
jgi:hypothetical protein